MGHIIDCSGHSGAKNVIGGTAGALGWTAGAAGGAAGV